MHFIYLICYFFNDMFGVFVETGEDVKNVKEIKIHPTYTTKKVDSSSMRFLTILFRPPLTTILLGIMCVTKCLFP